LDRRERLSFRRGHGEARVVLQTASFQGHLVVRDVEPARRALLEGVGRGRAYGCGLLTLAPPLGTR
jgi:CRISPR system Cascade subunit CasE